MGPFDGHLGKKQGKATQYTYRQPDILKKNAHQNNVTCMVQIRPHAHIISASNTCNLTATARHTSTQPFLLQKLYCCKR